MRTIGLVTSSRADYGIYLPVLRALQADPDFKLEVYVTGMHLAPEFGYTVAAIEADGFPIAERVEMLLAADSPGGISKSMGLGVMGFAEVFSRRRPDILLVLGDRFEMIAAPLAALPFKIPVAHLHGGELTQGAMDDALRHSISKLSHYHFVSTEAYARRVIQLGEEPWRVLVCGAPSLDNLKTTPLLDPAALRARFGLDLPAAFLLVTFHPVTLEYEQSDWHIRELLAALSAQDLPPLFTLPNADTGGRRIIAAIRDYVGSHPAALMADNLGTQGYFSLMARAAAMVGNSSSGILEAASFRLPVVNIGTRQEGRLRAANVIDTGYEREAILGAIQQATSPAFRAGLAALENPYGDGRAAERILQALKTLPLGDELLKKRFYDLGGPA
jgi:UDP-hydrolysing UDP-N-acetyl-D-glucosamine 2-epimerase